VCRVRLGNDNKKEPGEEENGEKNNLSEREMQQLDREADVWVGTDLDRWYWYEGMKAKRRALQEQLKKSEKEADQSVQDLKQSLRELEALTGFQFLKGSDESFTPLAYTLFAAFFLVPLLVLYWISSQLADSFAVFNQPF